MKNWVLLVFMILIIQSCSDYKQIKAINATKIEQETLPFFNHADWTPEWINKNDSAYTKIHQIPKFTFMNQNGELISEKNLDGKIYVANFFFTYCRNICSKMTKNMSLLQEEFINDENIHLLSFSVNPESDSVPRLKKYALENKINSKKWDLLTGEKSKIYNLAKKEYFAGDSIGYYQSGNEFLHTENFILVDKKRRIRGVYNGTLLVEIERIINDIALLKAEN